MTTLTAEAQTRTRHLWSALVASELRVFIRRPVMIALSLLVPAGLLGIAALGGEAGDAEAWAAAAGRDSAAVMCITVYFIALSTITSRRHTLALKRLRTTALPDIGIVTGLLVPPVAVGAFQLAVVQGGMMLIGSAPETLLVSAPLILAADLTGIVLAALAGVLTSTVTANPEKAQWTMLPLFVGAMGAAALLPLVSEPLENLGLRLVPLVANADMISAGWAADPGLMRIGTDLGIIVAWLLVLIAVSARTFRWERRR